MKNQDTNLIAYCGLYCGECSKYKKGKCPGCRENAKATWCKIRMCCAENSFFSCADCKEHTNVNNCKKYNNFIAKTIQFFTSTDRSKCIDMIKEEGPEKFCLHMKEKKIMSMKK